MKLSALALICAIQATSGFSPAQIQTTRLPATSLNGYLDDLTGELNGPDGNPDPEAESQEATKMAEADKDRYGVGSWDDYVEFDEFDGGDGQMGVAGDGNKGLEGFDTTQLAKSKMMSAKNAWGTTSSGYADKLVEQGMDTSKAQQLENWANQQELRRSKDARKASIEQYDTAPSEDEDWRQLASFGVERNQDFSLDEAFGGVEIGDLEGTIEIAARMGGAPAVHEFGLKNQFMGFADFRAAFSPETGSEWTIEPTEGSLTQRENTNFLLRFRPQGPGLNEGYLVIETEDFKKTWKLVGSTS